MVRNLLILTLAAAVGHAQAQEQPRAVLATDMDQQIRRGKQALGARVADSDGLASKLQTLPSIQRMPADVRDKVVALRSQWLSASGINEATIARLEAKGLDVRGALDRDLFGSPVDYSLVSETVVVGTLQSIKNELLDDGLRSTATFTVDEVLKGSPGATVAVRQRSGADASGAMVLYDTDFTRDTGGQHLLFLSNGLYALAAQQTTGSAPANASRYYIPQRSAFEIGSDGGLQPVAKGVPVPGAPADVVISKIRALKLETQGGQ